MTKTIICGKIYPYMEKLSIHGKNTPYMAKLSKYMAKLSIFGKIIHIWHILAIYGPHLSHRGRGNDLATKKLTSDASIKFNFPSKL